MKIRNLFLTALAAMTMSQANAIETIVRADQTPGVSTQKDYMIGNGHFEKNVGNWKAYADAAAVTPVDGTGGSPSVTCTRTTSSPLSGLGSFLITKGATNRQGDGCGSTFSIDSADQAKVIALEFEYAIPSGTFTPGSSGVDSDLEFWIFDVTNSTLIPLSTFKIYSNSSSPSTSFSGYFQSASNSTSYRLIAHVATTNAAAWTFKADNFKIYRSKYVYGTPITDWAAFTPTGSWVTNTTYAGRYRRVGDSAEIQTFILTSGAPSGTLTALNLPTGLVIDTSKLSNGSGALNALGTITLTSGSGAKFWSGAVWYNTTTSVTPKSNISTGDLGAITATVPGTFGAADGINITYKVPIVGWASSTQMSDGAPQGPVVFKVNPATPTGTISSSLNDISWGAAVYDTLGGWNGSSTYTVKVPGYYRVNAAAEYQGSFAISGYGEISITINGAQVNSGFDKTWSTATTTLMPKVSAEFQLKSGDTIKIQSGTSGSTPTFVTNTAYNYFTISRIGDSATISATESVGAYYTGAPPTGTIAGSFNIVTYGTKVNDSHSGYSGGTYTIQAPGRYSISAGFGISGTYSVGKVADVAIFVNGVVEREGIAYAGGANSTLAPIVSLHDLQLKTGDLITIRSFSDATTPTFSSVASVNFFSIVRTGL